MSRKKTHNKVSVIHKTSSKISAKIATEDLNSAIEQLSPNALRLLMYYYSKGTGWRFDDEKITKKLGIKQRTLNSIRKELIDKGFIFIIHAEAANTYVLGKQTTHKFKCDAMLIDITDGLADAQIAQILAE